MEKSTIDESHHKASNKIYSWACNAKNLTVGETDTTIKNYLLHDIKIHSKNKEDEIYLTDEEVYTNIRRGNCIASYLDCDGKKRFKVGRKGLIKFFDYLHENNHKKDSEKIKSIVFDPVIKAFKSKKKIVVYITEKENGENIQISYDSYIKGWIIGSKNVSILARDENDLNFYKKIEGNKFSYCLEFADTWFRILNSEIIAKYLLEDFIKEIKDHTLVGENIGKEHQHIKLYQDNTIVFYSIVKNDSDDICLDLGQSERILKDKFNLNFVKVEKSKILNSYDEFTEHMEEKYLEILKKSVSKGGEGSVAYISMVDDDIENGEIISLCKFKTFEYRILRKLREKIKPESFNTNTAENILHKIEKECKEILGEEGDDIDLTGYMRFIEFVVKFVKNAKIHKNIFIEKYANFIEIMKSRYDNSDKNINEVIQEILDIGNETISLKLKIVDKNRNAAKKWIENKKNRENSPIKFMEELLHEANKINLDSVRITSANDKHSKNKKKLKKNKEKFDMQEIKRNVDTLEDPNINYELIQENKSKSDKINKVYFIACIGLVCSGKSTVYQLLQNSISIKHPDKLNLMHVSSDTIASGLIKEYMKKNPQIEFNEAFVKVKKNSKKQFTNSVIKKLYSDFDKNKINLFFLDKNFNDESVNNLNKELNCICGSDYKYKTILLHQETLSPINEKQLSFPFSWSYFIQAYLRLKNRKDHETLSYSVNKYAHYVLISFLFSFKGHEFNIQDKNITMCKISFVDEKIIEMPKDIIKLLGKIYSREKGNIFNIEKMKESDDLIEEFISRIDEMFGMTTFDDTRDKISKELEEIIQKHIGN